MDTAVDILSFRPGRKSFIFLATVLPLASAVYWDRKEAKRIRQEYCDKVAWKGKEPLSIHGTVRCVDVVSTKVWDDTEEDRGLIWFKKYMKVCRFLTRRSLIKQLILPS